MFSWQIKLRQFPLLMRALARTQRLMDPAYYLAEHSLLPTEAGTCTEAAARQTTELAS